MKKLYMLGIAITLGITCIGCGNTTEVTENTETATETVAEATTETAAKVKTTKKQDKNKNTTEETLDVVENDTPPDKTQTGNQNGQRTTEAANRQTTGSASTQPTTQAPVSGQPTTQQTTQPGTQQPVTERPTPTQPTTERPTPPVQTCEHQWQEIMETIHHPPVIGTRCVQPAVMYYWYCRSCGCYYPTVSDDPCGGANGGDACYTAREAVFEDYEAVPAYDEQVGTGRYRCSRCGVTK